MAAADVFPYLDLWCKSSSCICSNRIAVSSFFERHDLRGCMVSPTKIIAGLGMSLGIDIIHAPGATGTPLRCTNANWNCKEYLCIWTIPEGQGSLACWILHCVMLLISVDDIKYFDEFCRRLQNKAGGQGRGCSVCTRCWAARFWLPARQSRRRHRPRPCHCHEGHLCHDFREWLNSRVKPCFESIEGRRDTPR